MAQPAVDFNVFLVDAYASGGPSQGFSIGGPFVGEVGSVHSMLVWVLGENRGPERLSGFGGFAG